MFDFEMFFGRFHPLVVHLPIGFLALALLFKLLDFRFRSVTYRPALKVTLALSVVAAIIACITGLLLSFASTYPAEELDGHMWAGIGLAVVTVAWYLIEFVWEMPPVARWLSVGIVAVLVFLTGHRGGTLTHGSEYLLEGMPVAWQQLFGRDPNAADRVEFDFDDLDNAVVYEDIVVPVLESRCYSCHGGRKQKGELRLDGPEWIGRGGESGDPLISGDLARSKLYHVLTLPLEDDLHMPPRGRTQLSKLEIEVLGAWIADGGNTETTVMQLADRTAVDQWYDDWIAEDKLFAHALIPTAEVGPPDEAQITRLQERGVLIQRVGLDNNYLEMSLINVPELTSALLGEALALSHHIIWMNLSGHVLEDAHLEEVVQFTAITDLNLAGSQLPPEGLHTLSALSDVQILNLTGTRMEGEDIEVLSDWPALRKVFTFQSGFSPESAHSFSQSNPGIEVDTGGYSLPVVARDSIVFRRN